MLTFLGDIERVSDNLAYAFLTDLTTWGGANPNRNEGALFVYLYKRDSNNNDTAITIDNSNATTAVDWQFALPANDGNFISQFYFFLTWQAGTYASGTGRYYAGNYYLSNTSTSQTPGAGSEWTLITDVAGQVTGNTTVQQGQFYAWSSARSEAGPIADALADLSSKIRSGANWNWNSAGAALTGLALANGSFANFRKGDYVNAQKDIDFTQAQTAASL